MQVEILLPAYFLPRSWPILASQRPHLCSVTPRYLELPLANPVLCRRSMCTNSSLVQFLIWRQTHQSTARDGDRPRKKIAEAILTQPLPASDHPRSRPDWSWCQLRARGTWSQLDRTPCVIQNYHLSAPVIKLQIDLNPSKPELPNLAAACAVSKPPDRTASGDRNQIERTTTNQEVKLIELRRSPR